MGGLCGNVRRRYYSGYGGFNGETALSALYASVTSDLTEGSPYTTFWTITLWAVPQGTFVKRFSVYILLSGYRFWGLKLMKRSYSGENRLLGAKDRTSLIKNTDTTFGIHLGWKEEGGIILPRSMHLSKFMQVLILTTL